MEPTLRPVAKIKEYPNSKSFPEIGDNNTLYLDKEAGITYAWDHGYKLVMDYSDTIYTDTDAMHLKHIAYGLGEAPLAATAIDGGPADSISRKKIFDLFEHSMGIKPEIDPYNLKVISRMGIRISMDDDNNVHIVLQNDGEEPKKYIIENIEDAKDIAGQFVADVLDEKLPEYTA